MRLASDVQNQAQVGDEDISAATPFGFWSRPRRDGETRQQASLLGSRVGEEEGQMGLSSVKKGRPRLSPRRGAGVRDDE